MNKTELVEKIAAGAGISKVDAKKALDAAVVAVKDALIAGDKVALVGFGTLVLSPSTSVPLVRVSTPPRRPRLRLLPRKLQSSRLALSLLML